MNPVRGRRRRAEVLSFFFLFFEEGGLAHVTASNSIHRMIKFDNFH